MTILELLFTIVFSALEPAFIRLLGYLYIIGLVDLKPTADLMYIESIPTYIQLMLQYKEQTSYCH